MRMSLLGQHVVGAQVARRLGEVGGVVLRRALVGLVAGLQLGGLDGARAGRRVLRVDLRVVEQLLDGAGHRVAVERVGVLVAGDHELLARDAARRTGPRRRRCTPPACRRARSRPRTGSRRSCGCRCGPRRRRTPVGSGARPGSARSRGRSGSAGPSGTCWTAGRRRAPRASTSRPARAWPGRRAASRPACPSSRKCWKVRTCAGSRWGTSRRPPCPNWPGVGAEAERVVAAADRAVVVEVEAAGDAGVGLAPRSSRGSRPGGRRSARPRGSCRGTARPPRHRRRSRTR